jgi:ribose 5-phosphate isomerase B
VKVGIGSDHRGFKLKEILAEFLRTKGFQVLDYGTYSGESCDYPDYVYPLSLAVRSRKIERGILICYTGIGSCIAANKVKGIRAGLVYNLKTATLARKHNNTNIIVLGTMFVKPDLAKKIIWRWLNTEFEGGRHSRRLRKIREIEERECLER